MKWFSTLPSRAVVGKLVYLFYPGQPRVYFQNFQTLLTMWLHDAPNFNSQGSSIVGSLMTTQQDTLQVAIDILEINRLPLSSTQ